jgi:CHAT domain-containing protein
MRLPRVVLAVLLAAGTFAAAPASSQSYARFDVADSSMAAALRASGTGFEAAWNALLVGSLRAQIARADSAARLERLARRVAAAEPAALGSTIARDALALAATWRRDAVRTRIRAAVSESLGVAALGARRFGDADSLYQAALAGYRVVREKRRAAWMMGSLGLTAYQASEIERADSLYVIALAARRELGDARMIGATLNSLGSTRLRLHRPAEAYAYLVEARAVREKTGEHAALGSTLASLALAQDQLGHSDSASVTLNAALAATVAAGDSARTLEILINYAIHLNGGGRPIEAYAAGERGARLARERGDAGHEASCEQVMGDALRLQGRFTAAAEHYENALRLSRDAGDASGELGALLNLGRQSLELENAEAARPPLERALRLADSLGDASSKGRALGNLAIAASLANDSTRARSLALQAVSIGMTLGDSAMVHASVITLGDLLRDRHDYAAALPWFERARGSTPASDVEQTIADELNLGATLSELGRLDEAQSHLEIALDLAKRAGASEEVWKAMLDLGDVAERRRDFPRALALDRGAVSLIDTLRARQAEENASIVLLSRRLFAYEALIHLLGKLAPQFPDSNYDAEAFTWAERTRARALLDVLAAQGHAAERLAPADLASARAALPNNKAALLEYSLGDSSSALWVVTPHAWKRLTLPPRAALTSRAEVMRRGLADPEAAESRSTRAASRALYRQLIEPAEPWLKGVDDLIVAADGALALVPFEALLAVDVKEGSAAPRGAYAVERFAISYTPSAAAMGLGGTSNASAVLALGNPAFGPLPPKGMKRALDPLPGTADEIAAIREAAGSRPLTSLEGRDATAARLRAAPALDRALVLHIATHGIADDVAPERCGLWLAAESDTTLPEFLSMRDILALKLEAALVTLSACQTGLGRLERGEGVMGLSRAFLAAGARSTIVSLWNVNDRSSALLMRRFYAPLFAGRATRARALADAKRALLANTATRSPFHWAPFVLVGASGELVPR